MNECMHACMHGLTVVCVCLCMCMWLVVRSTCLQGGAVYIADSGDSGGGTFTNCNFTSNSAYNVSLEEEHVDGCV